MKVYVLLQVNEDDTTDLVGVYSNQARANKELKQHKKLYSQYYYIDEAYLDLENEKIKGEVR
jgi:hypothetical protein